MTSSCYKFSPPKNEKWQYSRPRLALPLPPASGSPPPARPPPSTPRPRAGGCGASGHPAGGRRVRGHPEEGTPGTGWGGVGRGRMGCPLARSSPSPAPRPPPPPPRLDNGEDRGDLRHGGITVEILNLEPYVNQMKAEDANFIKIRHTLRSLAYKHERKRLKDSGTEDAIAKKYACEFDTRTAAAFDLEFDEYS